MAVSLLVWLTINLYVFVTAAYSSGDICNASKAFVQITSPSSAYATITSYKTSFAPNSYYIAPTKLTTLNVSIDNICIENGIKSKNISGSVLLIFESTKDCSTNYQIYTAQQYNVKAILLANDDISNQNDDIYLDDTITNTPTRRIPFNDGLYLQNATLFDSIFIEFGCFNTSYPPNLCVFDSDGAEWHLDGDYQQIYGDAYNDYPMYKKSGYAHLLSPLYLYQRTKNSKKYWTISSNSNFANDDDPYIGAECTEHSLFDASLCTQWSVNNDVYPYLNVSADICALGSDNHVCIHSKQSNLAGLGGSYKQIHSNVPFWFRELDDCDHRAGWLYFDGLFTFALVDVINSWVIAQCVLESEQLRIANIHFMPSLCTQWYTIVNDSLTETRALDETFEIQMDTKCDEGSYECVDTQVPETFCMTDSSVMHGFLEGEYKQSGFVGPKYGTFEYERNEQLMYDDELVRIYIWWFGEIDDAFSWWVISETNLSTAIANDGYVDIYAFCESKVKNPIDCSSDWKFYFVNAFHTDTAFRLYSGRCVDAIAPETYVWPNYICMQSNDESTVSKLDFALYEGGYVINESVTVRSDGFPHWIKRNDDESEIYLYFESFFGYWQVGNTLHVEQGTALLCFQESDYLPTDCDGWFDVELNRLDDVFEIYACSESEFNAMVNGEQANNLSAGQIFGIVFGILCVIGIGIYCFYALFWKKYIQKRVGLEEDKNVSDEMNGNENEVIDEADDAGLTQNASEKKMDFSPLNTEQTASHSHSHSHELVVKKKTEEDEEEDEEEEEEDMDNDDEKKDESVQGIDNRRMSQQMIKAMQSNIDEWTEALIADPVAASRKYSRHSSVADNVPKTLMFNDDDFDPLNIEKKKEEQNNEDNDNDVIDKKDKEMENEKEESNDL